MRSFAAVVDSSTTRPLGTLPLPVPHAARAYKASTLSIFLLAFLFWSSIASAASLTASWNANTEPDLAGYKLSYGIQSGTYTTVIDVGSVTTWAMTNLLPSTRYYFVVQA